jgi:hypothetical protein
MAKPNYELVAMLRELLKAVQAGDITEAFMWYRCTDNSTDYNFLVDDSADMLYELGTIIMDERSAGERDPVPS